MKSDIEIAQAADMQDINKIADKLSLKTDDIECYGKYKAKLSHLSNLNNGQLCENNKVGKLILVTALTPTPAGEGKTTVSIGLADALMAYGKKTALALREPSLGPVFGIKGGACGGGYAQVVPMEDINLHFTGDFHAIGAANNLLAAMIDNHIQQGNELGIDPKKITWKRAVDMNDRQLRYIVDGLGGDKQGVPREDGFDITVASEIMAVFCLASSIEDLKRRLSQIIIGYNYQDEPIYAKDLNAQGAMSALLKDAFRPNLVQTLENTPAFVHGGPFANIAHGCNSVVATKAALSLSDYVITEAGFGADLGAEKFLDIKCREANLVPSAVVVVATVRALKLHGGVGKGLSPSKLKNVLQKENLNALKNGFPNLLQHVNNIRDVYKLPCLVVVNNFPTDSRAEIKLIHSLCEKNNINSVDSKTCLQGSKDSKYLAEAVINICKEDNSNFKFSYALDTSIEDKINAIARKIYHADGAKFSSDAYKQMKRLEELGFGDCPVCVAKTQYSFSDDAEKIGAPCGFSITVRELKVSAGAGFIVALTGDIMTMPGLPKVPAAENIDVDKNGKITGLF